MGVLWLGKRPIEPRDFQGRFYEGMLLIDLIGEAKIASMHLSEVE